jgi:DNA-binding transcriptional LysR family regulator
MRDLDLTSLRLFVSVCETRNIARAGELANIVGSAISKRLAQLEETVGTPLLLRRRHGVDPTPAGETLLEHARSMLASSQRIERDMAAFASGVKGQVRVLATVSVLAESLAEDVAAFLQQPAHADIRVDMEEQVSANVARGIRQGSASLGICWASEHGADLSGLQTRPYRFDQLAIVVHPSHPLARRKSVTFEQTLGYEHVSLPVASAVQVMLLRMAAALGKTLQQRVIVSNFEAALRVVQARLAISVVPQEVARFYAASHDLNIITLAEPWAKRQFAICFKDEAALPAAAKLLLAHLEACGAPAPGRQGNAPAGSLD